MKLRAVVGIVLIYAAAIVVAGTVPTGAAVAAASGPAVASPQAQPVASSGAGPYYLALGDSVPVWDGSSSYPNLLLAHYQKAAPGLQLVNLAVSGETTTSMLEDGQYAEALAFLQEHQGEVAFITIDIGGNDVVGCGFGSDPNCFTQPEATMEQNLTSILDGLRAAAPGTPIYGMTYYDPFLGNWLAGGALQAEALAQIPEVVTLNNELTAIYGPANTADVQGAYAVTNSTTLEASPWGLAPVDVVDACQWLDIGCFVGYGELFGDDPNVAGQVPIALAFEKVIGPVPTTTSISSSPDPARIRQPVTYTASVGAVSPWTGSPTGTVSFSDNGAVVTACSAVTLSGGQASCTVSYPKAGSHVIVATYSGDANFAASTSPELGDTVTFCIFGNFGCDLFGANLVNANLTGQTFTWTNLAQGDLAGADLTGTTFVLTTMASTDLIGADLSGAKLALVDLSKADLTDANLNGAIFFGVNVTGATWSNTICPDGTNSNAEGGTCVGHL